MCKNCIWWESEWFRNPEDDPNGEGWRFCNHPGFVGGMKWGAMVTGETSKDCQAFEAKS